MGTLTIKILLQTLATSVGELVSVLHDIATELEANGENADGVHERAANLEEHLAGLEHDLEVMPETSVSPRAYHWAGVFSGVHRIVDARFREISHEMARKTAEKKVYVAAVDVLEAVG